MNVICITLVLIAAMIMIIIINTNNTKRLKAMGVSGKCPSMDDSIEQAKKIGNFISGRYEDIGSYVFKVSDAGLQPTSIDRIIKGKESGVIDLIRMCHACGCEVVIRQVDSMDIETSSNTAEHYEQYISSISST